MAGGYKNGVGGRVAEPIGQYVSVSKVGSILNRSLASEHLVDTFRRTIGRFVSEYVSRELLKSFFRSKNMKFISFLIYQSRRRGSSVALNSGRCARNDGPGDRPEYHTITDVRSIIIVILYFTRAYRRGKFGAHSQICAS